MSEYAYISTIGQDSHRFEDVPEGDYKIRLGGVDVKSSRPISANSDGDVILHAITNAVSGYTGVNILGYSADKLCLDEGIKDSRVYLDKSLEYLKDASVIHCSMTVECLVPKLKPYIEEIRENVGKLLDIPSSSVGITATTGEGLTGFGKGEGIQVIVILSLKKEIS